MVTDKENELKADGSENRSYEASDYFAAHVNRARRGRLALGGILILAALLMFMQRFGGFNIPYWLFSWPVLLIVAGLITGIRHNFSGFLWILLLGAGGLFLFNDIFPEYRLRNYLAPIILFAIGLVFLVRPRYGRLGRSRIFKEEYYGMKERGRSAHYNVTANGDAIEVTSIFSGIKRKVLSRSFRRGDIVCVMGGAEIDLTNADFNGQAIIDTTNVLGGTKLFIPSDWEVQSNIVTIFGGVDDKRPTHGVPAASNKTLVLDGLCLFGGVEIRGY